MVDAPTERALARRGNGKTQAGAITTAQDITGRQELIERTETQEASLVADARAEAEASYAIAQRFPRDLDQVRHELLHECDRPQFADTAMYSRPVGDKRITGESIRFVEVAFRALRHVDSRAFVVYDDLTKQIIRVRVKDLERNIAHTMDMPLEKTVERRKVREGQQILGQRLNSTGQTVYLVEATEGELAAKRGAEISKAVRTLGMRLIPGDLRDEARARIKATLEKRAKDDPDAERKRLADAFAALNVAPKDLKVYLGHELAQCSPAELVELRQLYQGIKSGETTWSEVTQTQSAENEAARKATDERARSMAAAGAGAGTPPPTGTPAGGKPPAAATTAPPAGAGTAKTPPPAGTEPAPEFECHCPAGEHVSACPNYEPPLPEGGGAGGGDDDIGGDLFKVRK